MTRRTRNSQAPAAKPRSASGVASAGGAKAPASARARGKKTADVSMDEVVDLAGSDDDDDILLARSPTASGNGVLCLGLCSRRGLRVAAVGDSGHARRQFALFLIFRASLAIIFPTQTQQSVGTAKAKPKPKPQAKPKAKPAAASAKKRKAKGSDDDDGDGDAEAEVIELDDDDDEVRRMRALAVYLNRVGAGGAFVCLVSVFGPMGVLFALSVVGPLRRS